MTGQDHRTEQEILSSIDDQLRDLRARLGSLDPALFKPNPDAESLHDLLDVPDPHEEADR